MRVLITGAGGFIGEHLVLRLAREGYQVRACVHRRHPETSVPSEVQMVEGDIRNRSSMKAAASGCEVIVHLAGKAHAIHAVRADEDDYHAVNVEGTRHVLDGAVAGGTRRIIFFSSVKVFGESSQGCVDESVSPQPVSPYGRSKWEAEQLVNEYSARGGLTSSSFRLPMVYGPSHKGNLFRMIAAIDRGRFPPLPYIRNHRSLLHVENLIDATLLAIRSGGPLRPCYVVTDARPYSITEVYDLLRKGLGLQPPFSRVPLWALSLGGRCGDIMQALLNKSVSLSSSTLEKVIGQAWYSPEALVRDMNYQPRYTFEDAVPELIRHYRSSLS
jgi:nucleoside-diphosphate-sugar epimerase